jgi:hypothetical protein
VTVRLDAYYFGFDSTGNEDIDRVLSAVACAGKAYHHTSDWTEPIAKPYEPTHRGGTCAEWIQNAANDAATKLAAAYREGVVEGLVIALQILDADHPGESQRIAAEIERLRGEA